MLFGLFGKKQNRCLGIDFGASGVKIVELSCAEKNRLVLQSYVIGQTKIDSKFSLSTLNEEAIAGILRDLLAKANISTRRAVISLPLGETFSTVIELPAMSEADLVRAIPYEAQKYVPVSFDEVVLDWSVIERPAADVEPGVECVAPKEPAAKGKGNFGSGTIQIFIVAVPKELIKKIAKIAKMVGLEVLAIEQEAFSIVRSLVGRDEAEFLIIDLGQEDADFIFVDKNSIRLTFSFDLEKKPDLVFEATSAISIFQARCNKKIAKIILTGGRAKAGQPNWAALFADKFKIPAGIGDPFARLTYEAKLKKALEDLAPFMAAAVGAAMREL